MELIYWIFVWLVCLCTSSVSHVTRLSEIELTTDEEDNAIEGSALSGQLCSPCQCQCYYPQGDSPGNSEASLHIQKQLTSIQKKLDKQSHSFNEVLKQVSFVQHDLESPRTPGCPDDFLYDRQTNMCFRLNMDKQKTWAEAQRYCQHLGPKTNLVTLDTADKVEVVREHLKQVTIHSTWNDGWNRQVWLGAIQTRDEGPWFWTSSGQPLSEAIKGLWGGSEPNNYDGIEHCLALAKPDPFPTWLLNDSKCETEQLRFICERKLD